MNTSCNMSFEEMVDVYSAFPLKESFLKAGNVALKKFGLTAKLENDTIWIHFLSKPYFTEDDLEEFRDNDFDENDIASFRKWTIEGEAFIKLNKELEKRIIEIGTDYQPDNYDDEDEYFEDMYDKITDEDENLGGRVLEAFLDAAVDVR